MHNEMAVLTIIIRPLKGKLQNLFLLEQSFFTERTKVNTKFCKSSEVLCGSAFVVQFIVNCCVTCGLGQMLEFNATNFLGKVT